MKFSSKLLIIFSIFVLITSCADDPNSIGGGLIPNEDKLKYKLINTNEEGFEQKSDFFKLDSLDYGQSTRILLGEYNNIKSEILLSFLITLPDSISTGHKDGSILLKNFWVEMIPDYWVGDSANFNFTAHKINEHWNSLNFNKDSLDLIIGSLGQENLISDFKYSAASDTSIIFSVDSTLVKNWVINSYDNDQFDNYGILLRPTTSAGIAGFQALTTTPSSPYPLLYLIFQKGTQTEDTIIVKPKLDLHYPIETTTAISSPNEFLLQGQISTRGKLRIDVSNVPKDILINSAILELNLNEANSVDGTLKANTLIIKPLSSYENVEFKYDSSKFTFLQSLYSLKRDGNVFSGEIRQIVQGWIDNFPNEGLEIRLLDEVAKVSKLTFYGSENSNIALRPKLKIYYSYR